MNICITGLDNEKVINFANKLATTINYSFINADNEFAPMLIKSAKYPTALVDDLLTENETKLLNHIKKTENCVVSMSAEMFLPNKHPKILKNSLTIVVLIDCVNEMFKNIQNLIKKRCKYSVSTKEELINLVKDKLL